MRKGQVLIVQFIIYFLIGFVIFTSLSYIFDASYIRIRKDLAKEYSRYVSNIIGSFVLNLISSCSNCEIESTISFKNVTKNAISLNITKEGNLNVTYVLENENFIDYFNLLNYTYKFSLFENYISWEII